QDHRAVADRNRHRRHGVGAGRKLRSRRSAEQLLHSQYPRARRRSPAEGRLLRRGLRHRGADGGAELHDCRVASLASPVSARENDQREDDSVDQLYRGPLAEFTAARNALAKEHRGADASRIRKLAKPTVVAWAVNQVYWHSRK